MTSKSVFFCGIGGSGMLPLAQIVQGRGGHVSGSDRSRDQGRTPEKFAALEAQGIRLFPQDGSGITENIAEIVASTAVENTIPDVAAAKAANIPVTTRPEMLARLFNASERNIAVVGTSGKSTVTGMIGFILHELGENPTMVNGAVISDLGSASLVGNPDLFVAEVCESTGAIDLYDPDIAVLTNIALDHMDMDALRDLFTKFCAKARRLVLNGDHPETAAIAALFPDKTISYREGDHPELRLRVPGRHNRSNAMAALAVIETLGLDMTRAIEALSRFNGIKRRLETIGTAQGVTVIDDFAHNPDKIAGSLAALRETPGRLFVLFQPHGYGPLKLTGAAMGAAFATGLDADDVLMLTQPLYLGGTVDTSLDSSVMALHPNTSIVQAREDAVPKLLSEARSGDRIVVMGARDDTLSVFARQMLDALGSRKHASP